MPLQKLQFRPGINREGTTLSNEGGWFDCDKIRFRSGYPEKIGGWTALAKSTFLGICRSLWNWVTLGGYNLIGVGTNLKFYVYNGGTYNDVTPVRVTTVSTISFPTTFTTEVDQVIVTVTDSSVSGLQEGDFVTFSGAPTIGNVNLNGEFQIQSLLSNIQYTIVVDVPANTGATAGGAGVTSAYQINTGSDIYSFSTGWGVGPWAPTIPVTLGANPIATNSGTNVVTVTQAAHGYIVTAGDFVIGTTYKIVSAGTTDFTLIGASSNAVGTMFTATEAGTGTGTAIIAYVNISGVGAGTYTPGNFVIGVTYKIASLGVSPDFTSIGAASNTVGVTFTATGVGSGTGTATVVDIAGIPVGAFNGTFEIIVPTISGANDPTTNTYRYYAENFVPGTPNVVLITANASLSAGGTSVVVAPEYPSVKTSSVTTSRNWGSGFTTGVGQQLRLWSQANFGQDLLFNPRGGAIYLYTPGDGVTNYVGTPYYSRGKQLGTGALTGLGVPTFVNSIMVSDATRITIAFGCNEYLVSPAVLDPMLIRWSAQENYLDWAPSSLNQAGGYRLSHGSQIVSALQTRQEILVWTDASVYSMQYLGPPAIYGFNILADNISIVSPNAVATASGVTYWMGVDKFYVYSGRVETLPCAVRTYIYNDINLEQAFQFFASTNEGYSEIWWFYCSAGSTVIDRYVIFNYLDRVWYYGTMGRTAWMDSPISQTPIAATYSNVLVGHEVGVNDATDPDSPQPISCYVQSSDFDIGDGHNYGFVWQIIPDLTFDGSIGVDRPQATFTVRPRRNPGSNYGTSDTPNVSSAGDNNYATQNNYNVQQFTQTLNARLRGRQMAFRVSSNTIGTQWQLGTPRLNVRPDGRK